MTPKKVYRKCHKKGSRNPKLESIIIQDPKWSYYARNVIKGRWVEAEASILGSKWESDYCDHFGLKSCELVPKPDYTL